MALVVHLVSSINNLASGEKYLIIYFVERDKNYIKRALQGITFLMKIPMGKYLMGGKMEFIMLECNGWKKCWLASIYGTNKGISSL